MLVLTDNDWVNDVLCQRVDAAISRIVCACPPMSLVLHDPSSSTAVKVETVVGGPSTGPAGPPGATAGLQWDYSPKSMDADGATSNGGTCGAESVISELNGDCSTDDTVSLAQTAIIKQVR